MYNQKVLVVDDDDGIREMLDMFLQEEGMKVNVARNGREALDILSRVKGWVVLLDINMPVMDGREVMQKLTEHPEWRNTNRVIIMSAENPLIGYPVCSECDLVYALLPKPFSLDRVLEAIKSLKE